MEQGVFKASSGRDVEEREDGSVMIGAALGYLSEDAAMDAAEFFQARRDLELGRWRDPHEPDCFALLQENGHVYVYDERRRKYGVFEVTHRGPQEVTSGDYGLAGTAARFLLARPVLGPWVGAKCGEVWHLTVDGQSGAFVVDRHEFFGAYPNGTPWLVPHGDERITAGRRIWPEVTS